MTTLQRFILVLLWPDQPAKVVALVNAIITAMTNNPYFPNPNPPLSVLTASLAAFVKAMGIAKTKAVGSKEARDTAELKLKTDVQHLMDFAQAVVDANTAQAAVMIASSGFQQKKVGKYNKPDVSIEWGDVSGSVVMTVRSEGDHVTYFFQFSTNQKDWTAMTPTHYATITAHGLTPGVTYYFRYQTLTTGPELNDWSQTYSILVK
jgi:hypothetical protein